MLTTGVDTIPGLMGSAGNTSNAGDDTINGAVNVNATGTSTVNTFSAADTIDGGTGTDTLNVIVENFGVGGFALPAAAIKNVEILNFRNVDAAAGVLTVNAANFAGEKEVNSDRSSAGVTITNLDAGAAAGIIGNGTGGNGALNVGYATPSAAATLNIRDGVGNSAQPVVTITTAPTAVTINSTGAANSLAAVALGGAATSLTIDAATSLSTGGFTGLANGATITVKGAATGVSSPLQVPAAATVVLGAIQPLVNIASVDASGLTAGGVQLGMNAASTGIQFKGGAGNDSVTTNGGTALLSTASIDAGAGTADRLVIANTADIVVAGDVLSKARGDLYKGFEQVQVQNNVIVNLDLLTTNNTIDAVRINETGLATGVTNLSATGAQNVTVLNAAGNVTIGVKGATTTGQIDTVKVTAATTAANAVNPINLTNVGLAGVENLEITGSNGALAANVGAVTLTTASAIDLSSIKLNNANAVDATMAFGAAAGVSYNRTAGAADNIVTIDAAQRAINLSIDATGSGDTQINASAYNTATGAAITGGAGNDLLLGSRGADIIKGGAGNDVLQGDVTVATAATSGTTTIDLNTLVAQLAAGDVLAAVDVTIDTVAYNNVPGTTAAAAALALAGQLVGAGYAATATAGVVTITTAAGAVAADVTAIAADFAPAPLNETAGQNGGTVYTAPVVATPATFDIDISAGNTSGADAFINIAIDGANFETTAVATGSSATVARDDIILAINGQSTTNGVISTQIVDGDTLRVTVSNPAGVDLTGVTAVVTADDTLGAGGGTVTSPAAAATATTGGLATVVAAEVLTLMPYTPIANGNLVVTVDGVVTANIAGTAATPIAADTIADALRTADGAAGLFVDADSGDGTLLFTTPNATVPVIVATYQAANTTTADQIAVVGLVTEVNGAGVGSQSLFAADTLTGDGGNNVFVMLGLANAGDAASAWNNGSTFTTMDTITDLDLGTAAQAGRVDVLDLTFAIATLANAGQPIAMNAQATSLFNAVNGLYTPGAALVTAGAGTAGLFTYNGDTYLIAERAGNGVFGADDLIIKVTGVTGALDLSDFV